MKTAKFMNVVLNISVTKPKSARSIRLPTAPANTRHSAIFPAGCRKTFFHHSAHARARLAAALARASRQVWLLMMEKAAPVF